MPEMERMRTKQRRSRRHKGRRCIADDARWVPPPLPDDPRKVRKIRNQLIILTPLGVVAMVISMLATH
jgi:hypothetical protein